MTAPIWTGELKRDKATGEIRGFIVDTWNWRITLTATPAEGGGYTLRGEVGEAPEGLRVVGIDGP